MPDESSFTMNMGLQRFLLWGTVFGFVVGWLPRLEVFFALGGIAYFILGIFQLVMSFYHGFVDGHRPSRHFFVAAGLYLVFFLFFLYKMQWLTPTWQIILVCFILPLCFSFYQVYVLYREEPPQRYRSSDDDLLDDEDLI